MRIILVIDHLGSGGAQRQMCVLAVALKGRGFDVELLAYQDHGFFLPVLEEAGIPVTVVPSRNKPQRIFAMRRAIRRKRPDVVIAFMETPSLLAELAGIPNRDFAVIASERVEHIGRLTMRRGIHFFFHRFADAVVSNSYTQGDFIFKNAPHLAARTHVITNGVDLEKFRPAKERPNNPPGEIYMLVIGRFSPQKNSFGLLEALDIIRREKPELRVTVDWYGHDFFVHGRPTRLSELYLQLREAIKQRSFQEEFRLHKPVQDVLPLYQKAEVCCLPSFFEGFSNVICEAMACGLPILASGVSDNSRLVKDSQNGFLFNPHDPREIAGSILRFGSLGFEKKMAMGERSRKIAEAALSTDVFVEKYIELINEIRTNTTLSTTTSKN